MKYCIQKIESSYGLYKKIKKGNIKDRWELIAIKSSELECLQFLSNLATKQKTKWVNIANLECINALNVANLME